MLIVYVDLGFQFSTGIRLTATGDSSSVTTGTEIESSKTVIKLDSTKLEKTTLSGTIFSDSISRTYLEFGCNILILEVS